MNGTRPGDVVSDCLLVWRGWGLGPSGGYTKNGGSLTIYIIRDGFCNLLYANTVMYLI